MNKKDKNFEKVFSKNYLKMNQIFWLKTDLLMPGITRIRKTFGINEDLPVIDPSKDKERYDEFIKKEGLEIKIFHDKIGRRFVDFYKELKKVREALSLGREWDITLARFAVTGILLPPPFSVFISEDWDKKTIAFELSKDTTEDDLLLAWKNIENIRKKMYGKARAAFPTKKGIRNFNKITALKVLKNDSSEVAGIVPGDKKYKRRKLDIIGDIYSDEEDISEKADKKRINKLKVAEHRLKRRES